MANYCSECTYLDLEKSYSDGSFWCERKLECHMANEIECDRFCKAYSRSSSVADSAYNYSVEHSSSSGCFLTTIICNILGFSDNNLILQTIRNFRNNILQNDEVYKPLLVEYDIIGPKIAEAISNDPLKKEIASKYFNGYILDIAVLIEEKQFEEAVNLYVKMTNELKNFYGINNTVSNIEIDAADIKESGHGIYKVKKITS